MKRTMYFIVVGLCVCFMVFIFAIARTSPHLMRDLQSLISRIYDPYGHIRTTSDQIPFDELRSLRWAVAVYKLDTGHFPNGGNAEIAQQLTGINALHKNYIANTDVVVSKKGLIIDAYGDPYIFKTTTVGLQITSKSIPENDPIIIDLK